VTAAFKSYCLPKNILEMSKAADGPGQFTIQLYEDNIAEMPLPALQIYRQMHTCLP
jgi:hypothetical protein